MEELWSLDSNMDELSLKRLDDGTWMFQASTQGEYGIPTVFLDRKNLKDLHDVLEQELYPERYFHNKMQEVSSKIWEEKPTKCPICDETLLVSLYREDGDFCPNTHGKLYSGEVLGKKVYRWYSILGVKKNNGS